MASPNNAQNKVKTIKVLPEKNKTTVLEIMDALTNSGNFLGLDENEKVLLEANGLWKSGMEEEATEKAWKYYQISHPDSSLTKEQWINVSKNAAAMMSPEDRTQVWKGMEVNGLLNDPKGTFITPWKEGYDKAIKDGVIKSDLGFDSWINIMRNAGLAPSQSSD